MFNKSILSSFAHFNNSLSPNNQNFSNNTLMESVNFVPNIFDFCFLIVAFFIFVTGIVGNALVIIVVLNNSHMRTVTNIFIVNLAIGDFLVNLICLPPSILNDVTGNWYFGQVMCKLIVYVQYVSVCISVMTLTAISYERYYAIVYPLKFQATKFRAKIIILIIWSLAILLCLPQPIVIVLNVDLTYNIRYCYPNWDIIYQNIFELSIFLVLYVLPIILICYTYSQVIIVLWTVDKNIDFEESNKSLLPNGNNRTKNAQQASRPARNSIFRHISNSNNSNNLANGHNQNSNAAAIKSKMKAQLIARRKAAKMLICVAIMFALCNLPIYILNILRFAEHFFSMENLLGDHAIIIFKIAHCLFYLNSCINPLIYYTMSDNFRKEFRKVLFCLNMINKSVSMHSTLNETSIATLKTTVTGGKQHLNKQLSNGLLIAKTVSASSSKNGLNNPAIASNSNHNNISNNSSTINNNNNITCLESNKQNDDSNNNSMYNISQIQYKKPTGSNTTDDGVSLAGSAISK